MNQINHDVDVGPDYAGGKIFGIVDILVVVIRNKWLIFGMPVAIAIIVAILSLLLPNVYRARTKLLPPQAAQSSAASMLSQLGVAGSIVGAAGVKNSSDLYVAMIKSRTLAERIIKRFNLSEVYDTPSMEVTRISLENNTTVVAGKDGLITVEVDDYDKKRSALIANAYIQELTQLTQVLAVTEASQRRLFFERQLEAAKDNLATAEARLKQVIDTKGVVSVDADSRAIVETVARLRALISAKEIELNAMRPFVTTANPEFARTQEELNSLKMESAKLENGRPADVESGSDSKLAGRNISGLENTRLLRNVKYYQMLYELLAKQYEVARLDEAKQSSIIQVLDPAIEPEHKVKPKRAIIVFIAGLISFFLALLWSFFREGRNSPAAVARWSEVKARLGSR